MKKITSTFFLILFAMITAFSQITIIDFDDISYQQGGWNGTGEIITNPKTDGINTSSNVAKYTTPANAAWGNCAWVIFDDAFKYSDLEKIEFQVLAPSATQMFVKLENTNGGTQIEAYATPVESSDWQTVTLNFSSIEDETEAAATTFDKIAIFFNVHDATGGEAWLYDNVVLFGEVLTPEPKSPQNLQITNVTNSSFTITWENDKNSTGTNIFLEEPAAATGNKYLTTVGAGVTSFTYEGTLEGITINENGVYVTRLEALPDNDWNAYNEALVNMAEQEGNTIAYDENFHIYICFGQSNMEGSAPIEAQDRVADSRFQVLQALDCSNLGREKAKWYSALAPLCQCYSQLSIADYFGKEMLDNLPENIKIGIVHVAVGGSDIRLFDKDIYTNYTNTYSENWFQDKITAYGGNPYQHLIDLAKIAQESGVVKGILLHQGETNTGDDQWPTYVKSVYDNILADLSLDADEVPLIAGEVGHEDQGGTCAGMNSIIATLPQTIPTAHVISSSGCTLLDDKTHFNSEGVRELGARYATKMLTLLDNTTGVDEVGDWGGYALSQNRPNPALGMTTISFEIPTSSYVSLKIVNLQGIEVAELAGTNFTTGKHSIEYNTGKLAKGVYFYTLTVDGFSQTQKMFVTK